MHFGSSLASQIYKALWSVILAAWGYLWNRRAELHSIQPADSAWPFVKGQAEPALGLSAWHEATFSAIALAASGWMPPCSTTVPFCITVWLCLHSVVMDTSRAQKRASFKLLLLPRRKLWDSMECVCHWIIMLPIWSTCPLALIFFFTSVAHVCIVSLFVTPLIPCTYSAVDGEQEGLTKSDSSASSSLFSCHCEPCIPLCLSESHCTAIKF